MTDQAILSAVLETSTATVGLDDVIIGAFRADSGQSYVVFGNGGLFATLTGAPMTTSDFVLQA